MAVNKREETAARVSVRPRLTVLGQVRHGRWDSQRDHPGGRAGRRVAAGCLRTSASHLPHDQSAAPETQTRARPGAAHSWTHGRPRRVSQGHLRRPGWRRAAGGAPLGSCQPPAPPGQRATSPGTRHAERALPGLPSPTMSSPGCVPGPRGGGGHQPLLSTDAEPLFHLATGPPRGVRATQGGGRQAPRRQR